ncbi:MAG: hypothetical protein ACREBS_05840, partial [Nitrososphaerales archaeon]
EEWPPSADALYQSNLTAINNTPPTNITGQMYYLRNIQQIRAEYLPVVMLGYPAKVFSYNTARWTDWPSYYLSTEHWNLSTFGALQPAGSGPTTTTHSTSTSSSGVSPPTTTTSQQSGTGSTHVTTTTSTTNQQTGRQTSTTTSSSNIGTIELIAGIIIIIIIIGGVAAYIMRRRPSS